MKLLHKCCASMIALLLLLCVAPSSAQAAGDVSYEFAFAVHSISDNRYLRHVGPDAAADPLHADEYYAIYMTIHNDTGKTLNISRAVLSIDDTSYIWKDLRVGSAYSLYLDRSATSRISGGTHICTLTLDGKTVYSQPFMMPRDWGSLMTLPTIGQLNNAEQGLRSPYIAFWNDFPGSNGLIEFSIDIHTDHQPNGTYICPISWWMNLSSLQNQYAQVWSDYGDTGGGYCGLQVWNDGTHGVIMTLWDVFCKDWNGNVRQIKAKVVYPEDATDTDHDNTSEGSFVHYTYPYDWEAGKDYRFLLQQTTGNNGNVFMILWIQDIAEGRWDKLFCFDTGMKNVWINSTGGFLEDFNLATAGEARTMEFWNVRAFTRNAGTWVNAQSVTFGINASVGISQYQGSYNFGVDGRSCWIITSGIPWLCNPNTNTGPYRIPSTESGQPY